jgi:hypothetical protein
MSDTEEKPMSNPFTYRALTADDQNTLMVERLRAIEADHFRTSIEVRLASVVGLGGDEVEGLHMQLASFEVLASALSQWLGLDAVNEDVDA